MNGNDDKSRERPKQERLRQLYEEMHELTLPKCRQCKPRPHFCCDSLGCEMAKSYARELLGIELKPVPMDERPFGNIPYLSHTGCTVEPHLRPNCTLHTCAINSLGFDPNDLEWTEKYFELRSEIAEAEEEATITMPVIPK